MTKKQRQKATQDVLARIAALNKAEEVKPFTLKDVTWLGWNGGVRSSNITVNSLGVKSGNNTIQVIVTDNSLIKDKNPESGYQPFSELDIIPGSDIPDERVTERVTADALIKEKLNEKYAEDFRRRRYMDTILKSQRLSDCFNNCFTDRKLPTITKDSHFTTLRDIYFYKLYESDVRKVRTKALKSNYEQAMLEWLDDEDFYIKKSEESEMTATEEDVEKEITERYEKHRARFPEASVCIKEINSFIPNPIKSDSYRNSYRETILNRNSHTKYQDDMFHEKSKLPKPTRIEHFYEFRDVYANKMFEEDIQQLNDQKVKTLYECAILDWLKDEAYYNLVRYANDQCT
jgi:hypothetical protein